MKPRLLHVLPGFGVGGTELRVAKLIRATAASFQHLVVSIDGSTQASDAAEGHAELIQSPPKLGPVQFPLAMRRLASRIAPTVIATYNWGATDMILGTRLGFAGPIVHNECGFNPEEAVTRLPRRNMIRRVLLNAADATIVVSRSLIGIARREFHVPERKLNFIRTGVDTTLFQPGKAPEIRREWNVPGHAFVCGYAGGLRAEKNVALLIQAFRQANVPNAWLVLVGDGPERTQLQQLALGANIVFAGNRADAPQFYRAFDLFVMSSLTEQTSNALLEAMATGLPCLVTDVGDNGLCLATPEQLTPSNGIAAYATALARLAVNPELRAQLAAANRQRAISEFSFARMVNEYETVWLKTLREKLGPAHPLVQE